MKTKLVAILAFIVTCLACHSSRPDLVGTWTSGLGGALTTYHFRKDGTFTIDNIYDGIRAVVEGTYSVENGKWNLQPTTSEIQGCGPQSDNVRTVIMQPTHVTLKQISPSDFQIGLDTPPLMMHRMLKEP